MDIRYRCCFFFLFFSFFNKKVVSRIICRNNCSRLVVCFECGRKKKTLCQLPAVIQSAGPPLTFDPSGLKALSLTLLHMETCILMHEPGAGSDGTEGHGGEGGACLCTSPLASQPESSLLCSAGGRLSADGCRMQSRKNAADSGSAEPERSGCAAD